MYSYIYKTTHTNGKFYIGRHTTKKIDDNYFGSGKWVRSIKDKSTLQKEILYIIEDFDLLKLLEEETIAVHKNNPLCMNFNNRSVGFASGNLNPSKNPEIMAKKKNWMSTEEGRRWLSENSPSKNPLVKEKRRAFAKQQLQNGTHNFQKPEVREKCKDYLVEMVNNNNPMKNKEILQKYKDKYSVECPHCKKVGMGIGMSRYHFNNCKAKNHK